MGNLVITPPGQSTVISWAVLAANVANLNSLRGLLGPWRPPQWNETLLYSMTVTQVSTEGAQSNILFGEPSGSNDQSVPQTIRQTQTASTTYFFDAVMRAEHTQDLTETRHPIQIGASVIDHAYMNPAVITLEIGMSDVMGRFASGQYTSNNSKSISAYQTFKSIQRQRLPITLNTRLDTYDNMLIRRIQAVDNKSTKFGLRAEITFGQIITASLAQQTVSARPDATDTTNEGTKQPAPPQYQIGNFPNATF